MAKNPKHRTTAIGEMIPMRKEAPNLSLQRTRMPATRYPFGHSAPLNSSLGFITPLLKSGKRLRKHDSCFLPNGVQCSSMYSSRDNNYFAFLSYTHFDDQHNRGSLTQLREQLSAEVRAQTGEHFEIFQDRNDISWGQNWHNSIDDSIASVTFLIPIITPSFFKSEVCREELEKFLKREIALTRDDLILPIYFIDTPLLNEEERRAKDALAEAIASHQYADWRHLRFEPFTSPSVRKELERLALQIRQAIDRIIEPRASTISDAILTDLFPKEQDGEPGLLEAQEAAWEMAQIFKTISEEMKDSTSKANEKILRLRGSALDRQLTSLIAADLNAGNSKVSRLQPRVEENIETVIHFFSGYIAELDPNIPSDIKELEFFEKLFQGLIQQLTPVLEDMRNNRSELKLRLSSEVIRAIKRRNEWRKKVLLSMVRLYDFCEETLSHIKAGIHPKDQA